MSRYPIETLTPAECRELLRVAGRGITAARTRALVVLLWRAGLRVSEALSLAPRDVDYESGMVRVRHGKGGKQRTVALDVEACAVVREWSRRAEELAASRDFELRFILCTLAGKQLTPDYVRALLPRLARRAGITKRVHAHGLRHTYAAELAAEGVPLNVIQRAMGHANVATTSGYLAHVFAPEVVAAVRARPSWLATSTRKAARPAVPPPHAHARLSARRPSKDKGPTSAHRTTAPKPAPEKPGQPARAVARGKKKSRATSRARTR